MAVAVDTVAVVAVVAVESGIAGKRRLAHTNGALRSRPSDYEVLGRNSFQQWDQEVTKSSIDRLAFRLDTSVTIWSLAEKIMRREPGSALKTG